MSTKLKTAKNRGENSDMNEKNQGPVEWKMLK